MRIAPALHSISRPMKAATAIAAATLLLAGCTISGPGTLGETGSVGQAGTQVAQPGASSMATAGNAGMAGMAEPQAPAPAAAAPTQPRAKVAMLLPLSGPPHVAMIAKGLKQAGELALFELDNPVMQLVVKDDKGTPEGARLAAEEAVKEGAELILGPLMSASVAAAAPAARTGGVPVVAFSNDAEVGGNGVYLLSFLVAPEIDRIAAYATSHSRRHFAALFPPGPYGARLEASFRAAITGHGGTLGPRDVMAADAAGLVEPMQRLADAIKAEEQAGRPVDALIVPGGHETLAAVASLMAATGLDATRIKLIGTGGWDLPASVQQAAMEGAWFAGPDPRGWRSFAERFAKAYGSPPPRLATLAYDGVALAVALANGPPKARYTAVNLTRASGFNGADGHFRLLPGGLSERALAVLELQKFGVNAIDPAPGGNASSAQLGTPASTQTAQR